MALLETLYPYAFMMLLALVLGYPLRVNENRARRRCFCLSFMVLLCAIAALRATSVGVDTEYMSTIFDSVCKDRWTFIPYEKAFSLILTLCSYTGVYQTVIAVTATLINCAVFYLIIRDSRDVVLSVIVYIGLQHYAQSMNLMRQLCAFAILIFAYEWFIKRGKWWYIPYAICVGVMFLFHKSAVILLAIPLLIEFPKICTCLIVGGTLVFHLFYEFLSPIILKVFTYDNYEGGIYLASNYFAAVVKAVVALSIFGFCLFFYLREKRDEVRARYPEREKVSFRDLMKSFPKRWQQYGHEAVAEDRASVFELMCLLLGFVFATCAIRVILFDRPSVYFTPIAVVAIPRALDKVRDRRWKIALTAAVIVACCAYYFIVTRFRPEWCGVTPYRFFWQA